MPDRVLVTGISGFLGGHLALQLLEAGYIVRGSVRDLKKSGKVRDTLARHGADVSRLEFVALDLARDDGWAEAVTGVRYLQHVASPFLIEMPRDKMEMIGPAVEGTRRALRAAFASEVERVVLTSSMAAIMYGHDKRRTEPFTGADWTNLESDSVNAYVESKTLAERAAWELADAAGRSNDLVTINPGGIFGPMLDEDPGTSGLMIVRLLKGSVPAAPKIALIIIDVRDVAALHIKAMTTPSAGGHRFPLSSGTYSILEMSNLLRPALPEYAARFPRFEAPDWLLRIYALVDADVRGNLGELGTFKQTDAVDAKALLGRPLIPAADALIANARSIIAHHLA